MSGAITPGGIPSFDTKDVDVNHTFKLNVLSGIVCLSTVVVTLELSKVSDGSTPGFELPEYAMIIIIVSAFICFAIGIGVVLFGIIVLSRKRKYQQYGNIQEKVKEPEGFCDMTFGFMSYLFCTDLDAVDIVHTNEHSSLLSSSSDYNGMTHSSSESLPTKQMAFEDLVIGKRIGKGSYGEVFKGTWRGSEVAIKKLPYYWSELDNHSEKEEFVEDFLAETELMTRLRHPNIVQLYASFTTPEICMVMEFMSRGSLHSLLHSSQTLSWDIIKRLMIDATKGMSYLHSNQPIIIHRDLKSHNLLVSEHW
eukprot:CAMPEP_0174279000 /NCGR_PEP_ID=MMETSP0439-20130205/61790_1 /TAXON_ID=0 /ORGANISM="Stereomyxa ramosa, Strain Chinc5" /LENGTH=307 /DNA_ID=CAMNT_0015371475 /DNA_START=473 /DNA_END=1393 /DNA_ORIENTATION=-